MAVFDFRRKLSPIELPEEGRLAMPAEWAPREGTWLGWPCNRDTWPELIRARVESGFRKYAEALASEEDVNFCAGSPGVRARIEAVLDGADNRERMHLHEIAIDDSWLRDSGPIFVRDRSTGKLAVTDWDFDKWGGKYPPWDKDNLVPTKVASLRGMDRWVPGMTLEGGSIDVDGEGTLLTTEQCLLNENRNPWLDRTGIELRLNRFLGARKVLWLGRGVDGDDTDGHVDDLARFLAPGIVCAAVENDVNDENHAPLADNFRRLRTMRDAAGRKLEVVPLPMPKPVVQLGLRTPASYCNFLFTKTGIVMPAFGDPLDELAIKRLEAATGRKVTPVDCREIIYGQGSLHCLSQQEPAE
jgi:agmatine deiminase